MIVRACPVPKDALLSAYVDRDGAYTDCFEVMYSVEADLPAFITAFYTTWLFRLERFVLTLAFRRPIRDVDVEDLAAGRADRFAIWAVEGRAETQILLRENSGATRSYLAVEHEAGGGTRLIFGSAVVNGEGGTMPLWVQALTPLHVFYSRGLLQLAERKLRRG